MQKVLFVFAIGSLFAIFVFETYPKNVKNKLKGPNSFLKESQSLWPGRFCIHLDIKYVLQVYIFKKFNWLIMRDFQVSMETRIYGQIQHRLQYHFKLWQFNILKE